MLFWSYVLTFFGGERFYGADQTGRGGPVRAPVCGPRYNVAPTQRVPVIYHKGKQAGMKLMRWGFVQNAETLKFRNPKAKTGAEGEAQGLLINARGETLGSRAAFREAYQQRRCLIPADGFYEWQVRAGKRQPFRVMFKSGEPFCFAGLWRSSSSLLLGKEPGHWEEEPVASEVEEFVIITRAANTAMKPLHERMPVIIGRSHYDWWLKDSGPGSELYKLALEHAPDEPLKIYPVSDLVNSPKTDDPRCVAPVRIDRDWLEQAWWGDW